MKIYNNFTDADQGTGYYPDGLYHLKLADVFNNVDMLLIDSDGFDVYATVSADVDLSTTMVDNCYIVYIFHDSDVGYVLHSFLFNTTKNEIVDKTFWEILSHKFNQAKKAKQVDMGYFPGNHEEKLKAWTQKFNGLIGSPSGYQGYAGPELQD